MNLHSRSALGMAAALLMALASIAAALTLDNEKETHATLSGVTATLTGHSELHITGGGDPIPGCTIHLNSEDGWVFFHGVLPTAVVSNLLSRIRVNGTVAVADVNVRVVQHVSGAVVIPHPAGYRPLTVFTGEHLTGGSTALAPYTAHGVAALGPFAGNIRSFRLKRGYTATFARNENGTGFSRNYVAQDSDIEISHLPSGFTGTVRFVRVFPWRWTSKKGSCDVTPNSLNAKWHYNWDINQNSPRNWEYVAIKQQPHWPGLNQNWQERGVNQLLGFNEPDNPVEDAYKNLSPQGSVSDAVARWPELLGTGLRVGAPAVTDGGVGWLFNFMNQANAAGHRVDFVPVHYYRSYANNNDPAGAANQMYNFLKNIYDTVQRPIWVTEFNNGANWTNNAHDPNTTQNRNVIQAMIQMMDNTPWIERYAIYSKVEWFRQTHYDDGGITPMGAMYRDHVSPMAYLQEVPNSSTSGNADYLFEGNVRDSRSGNNALVYGTPKFVPGKHGAALSFDGTDDYLSLPGRLGDSTNFSFAGWVKWNGGANWQRIFDLGNGTTNYLYLTPKSADNTLRFGLRVGGTQQLLNASALAPGVWTHIAVTINGNTGKLFVNGTPVNTNNDMTLTPAQVGTETNYIGKSQWASDPLFSGLLDDIRFFNHALTDSAVAALAAAAPPEFVASRSLADAPVDLAFTADLASQLAVADGEVMFEKIGGPAWLGVSADGRIFGVPRIADLGPAELIVRASSPGGAMTITTIPIKVVSDDYIARYTFESNFRSSVGTAHATLSGGPTYIAGQIGQSLNLDGTDDHAVLPAGIASADEITVAAWVRWNSGGNWQRIFDFGNGTGSYLFLTPGSGANTMRLAIRNGGGEQSIDVPRLAPAVWTHLAVTLGPDGGKVYVNGSMAGSNPEMTIKPSDFNPGINYIGRSQFTADPYFSGRIDEFHIFHRALDVTEINRLRDDSPPAVIASPLVLSPATPGTPYHANIAGNISSGEVAFSKVAGPEWLTVDPDGRVSGIPGDADSGNATFRIRAASDFPVLATDFDLRVPVQPPADLRAHYEFDGAVTDSAGTYHGTAHSSPEYTAGLFDQSIALGTGDRHVQLPAGIVSGLTDATFSVRFRWDGGSAWQRVFDFGNNTSQYLFLTPGSGAGTLRFSITLGGSGSQQTIETASPPVGEWTHVAVVLEGNTGKLYVNGAPASTGIITLDPADIAPTLNYVGKSQWPDPYFNGAIDDFRIFGRALDAGEIHALAIPPPARSVPPPANYVTWASSFPFDEGQDAPSADPDGNGVPNVIEWLFGTDPLNGLSGAAPPPEILPATAVGIDDGKTYFGFSARIRKIRPGVTLIPEGASDPGGLGTPESASRVQQAGPPADDGDFEIFTWFYETPIEDAPGGFMRLRVLHEP